MTQMQNKLPEKITQHYITDTLLEFNFAKLYKNTQRLKLFEKNFFFSKNKFLMFPYPISLARLIWSMRSKSAAPSMSSAQCTEGAENNLFSYLKIGNTEKYYPSKNPSKVH